VRGKEAPPPTVAPAHIYPKTRAEREGAPSALSGTSPVGRGEDK
jgi:hypothetical protein